MQASDRARELERKYQNRRGHTNKLSISDDNHHITEAIGDMYGENDYPKRDARPLSFISSPLGDSFDTNKTYQPSPLSPPLRSSSSRGSASTKGVESVNGSLGSSGSKSPPFPRDHGPKSPPPLNRNNSDTAQHQFPLNDIDYESSPAAVAQELSNLQAIRRMSMDVNTSDPDLPSFNSAFGVPSMAPSHSADEDDASRLFWVPARLHPELAPKEFKTFIEEKVDKIRRRSGSEDTLSPDGLGRQGSGGGLRRKKSMLSRQIDDGKGYNDGAEILERKKSGKGELPNIQELEHLVNDPSNLQRMSMDTARRSSDPADNLAGDMPILPPKPAGQTLKRSTRTNYRRGSLRKGERVPVNRRAVARQSETDTEESPVTSPVKDRNSDVPILGLTRVQTEPVPRPGGAENFSRKRSIPMTAAQIQAEGSQVAEENNLQPESDYRQSPQPRTFHSRIASNGRTTAQIPQIIETPPSDSSKSSQNFQIPERKDSHGPPPSYLNQKQQQPQPPPPPPSPPQPQQQPQPQRMPSSGRPSVNRQPAIQTPQSPSSNNSLDEMAAQLSPLPGSSSRTDSLSFIPTITEEKKPDKKHKEKKDDEAPPKKSSWWSFGSDEKDKQKEKERKEREKEEQRESSLKKTKSKLLKGSDKGHDNTRLDVLQTSIDGGKGRESVVIDRESIKLEEERRKESSRKSAGSETKKEKDGLFHSLFGSKRKSEKESSSKKSAASRGLSPEPPPKIMKPDIDYNWTRFSILEERAIYRMAHIKLANPRRELYSQVLLSNFMYSYLAKVQQMHPQRQVTQQQGSKSQQQQPQQSQQQQRQAQQRKEQQPEEFGTYQRYQEQQARAEASEQGHLPQSHAPRPESNFDNILNQDSHDGDGDYYHSSSRGGPTGSNSYSVSSSRDYMGHQDMDSSQPYYQQGLFDDSDPPKDDDMW